LKLAACPNRMLFISPSVFTGKKKGGRRGEGRTDGDVEGAGKAITRLPLTIDLSVFPLPSPREGKKEGEGRKRRRRKREKNSSKRPRVI